MKAPLQKNCRVDVKEVNGTFTTLLIDCENDSLIFWLSGICKLTETYKRFKYTAKYFTVSLWVPFNLKQMVKFDGINYVSYTNH